MHVIEAFKNAPANSTMNSFFFYYDFLCKFPLFFLMSYFPLLFLMISYLSSYKCVHKNYPKLTEFYSSHNVLGLNVPFFNISLPESNIPNFVFKIQVTANFVTSSESP